MSAAAAQAASREGRAARRAQAAPVAAGARHEPHGVALLAIVLILAMGNFLAVLDMTIANVLVPHIAGGLASSSSEGTWVITGYGVAEAIMVPLTGWLTERFGPVRVFVRLHRRLRRVLGAVRHGDLARHADRLPGRARRLRRAVDPDLADPADQHRPQTPSQRRAGGLVDGDRSRADRRPGDRRPDRRQLELAVGLLYQDAAGRGHRLRRVEDSDAVRDADARRRRSTSPGWGCWSSGWPRCRPCSASARTRTGSIPNSSSRC